MDPFKRPSDFIALHDIDPSILQSVRYATKDNFVGTPVKGYIKPHIIMTQKTAFALKKVQKDLEKQGFGLVIYDAYRPQKSVDHFVEWAENASDVNAQKFYYPTLTCKGDAFKRGYIAKRSTHSRGSTVDLTLIYLKSQITPISYAQRMLASGEKIPFLDDGTLDMGSSFDLFHEVSHHDTLLVDEVASKNRNLLRVAMTQNGFKEYDKEWWHYTLKEEPYVDTFFDFDID